MNQEVLRQNFFFFLNLQELTKQMLNVTDNNKSPGS